MSAAYDVVALGNALVDILAHEDDAFIAAHGLARGAATMVDAAKAATVYDAMNPATEMSGGSAANTVAGVASFGGTAAFIGKVRDDQLGQVFAHDLRAIGVHFDTPPATEGPPTGRCLVVVTDDAERTMCTHLGIAGEVSEADVDAELVRSGAVTYLEGYLWDQPVAKAAIRAAIGAARDAGRKVALTLSDPFCVERHRDEFLDLIAESIDIVFANEHEARSLFQTDSFDDAVGELAAMSEVAAVTRSAAGSLIAAGSERHAVPAEPVEAVVDVTGAGDLYAAGFLYGYTHDLDLEACGRLGSIAAAEVISHLGPRPQVSLADLAAGVLAG